jgi:hypothetical protein
MLLGQLAARIEHQRGVQIARRAGRARCSRIWRAVVGQVGAAHDVADALFGVVHHHGQLIGPQPVGAAQHEVADFGLHVLPLRTEPAVLPFEPRCGAQPRCVQAPGPRRAPASLPWRQVPG